jgi:hypothetical protein
MLQKETGPPVLQKSFREGFSFGEGNTPAKIKK